MPVSLVCGGGFISFCVIYFVFSSYAELRFSSVRLSLDVSIIAVVMWVLLCGSGDCKADWFWLVFELVTVVGSIGLLRSDN